MYPIYFLYSISQLIYTALTKLKKSEQWAVAYLQLLEQNFDGHFNTSIVQKVAKFQSIQLHFVANTFSGLFNRTNNPSEIESNMDYFLMTVLYDALIDEDKISDTHLNDLFYHPTTAKPSNFNERVLVAIHLKLLDKVNDKKEYWKVIESVHLAQKDSSNQFDKNTSIEQIVDITKRKGGFSLLMCRHYLIDPPHASLDTSWYHLGALIQMTNDLFDTYKDGLSNINTFATKMNSIAEIEALYQAQKQLFYQSIQTLPVNRKTKVIFAIKTAIIPAFGDIAIQQLSKLQSNDGLLPNLKLVPRAKIIIDMEKPINQLKLISYAYKNGKRWM
jgi:hypothetical protein